MFEWESEVDIGELIEAQRLRIERAKEAARLESEVNRLIDDRISKYNTELEIQRLLMDTATKGVETQISLEKELEKEIRKGNQASQARITELQNAIENQRDLNAEQLNGLMQNQVMGGKFKKELEDIAEKMKNASNPKELERLAKEFEKLQAKINDTKKFNNQFGSSLESVASKFGLAANAGNNKTLGPMIKMFAELTKDASTFPAKIAGIGKAFGTMFGPLNLAIMFLGKLIDMMFKLDKAQAKVAGSTGLMREQFDHFITGNVTPELTDMGIKTDELADSANAMIKTMGTLNQVNKKAGDELIVLGAKMAKLGGTAEGAQMNVLKLSNLMGGSFLNNSSKASASYEIMIAKGRELGLTTADMESGLKQFGGQIAGMGGDVGKEFLTMSTMAKNAGVELGKLMGLAKAFQTFKDGADKAAELNSILGTSISSIEMMGKTSSERMEIIRKSINSATGGFQGMDRYTQLAAAQMLGFGENLDDLAGFLNTGVNPAQQRKIDADKAAKKAAEENAKAVMQTRDAMTQIADRIESLFVKLMPLSGAFDVFTNVVNGTLFVLEMIAKPIEWIVALLSFMYDNIWLVLGAMGIYEIGLIALAFAQGGFSGAVLFANNSLLVMAGKGIYSAVAALWTYVSAAFGSVGASYASAAGVQALALSFGKLMIKAAIIIGIFYLLAKVFGIKINPPFVAVFAFMAIGVGLLALALNFMGPVATAAAYALGLMAAGIALIFFGIGYLIDKFKELLTAFPELIMQMPMMVAAFQGMVFAIGALGIAMGISALLVAQALSIFALAFIAVGQAGMFASFGIMMGFLAVLALVAILALAGSSISDLAALGESVLAIGEGIKAFGEGLASMASGAAALIAGLGGDKTLFVRKSAENTTMIAGKAGGFFMIPPTIKVDVKMPDVDMTPKVTVNVFIDGEEFKGMIYQEVNSTK